MNARCDRRVLRAPADFAQRYQLHVDLKLLLLLLLCFQSAAVIAPHAIRAPEFPDGSVFKSSSFSCTTTDLPMIESFPLRLSFPFQSRCALPEASASMLPRSPE